MKTDDLSRRSLIGAAWTAASASRVLGANDRIRAALIGCGNRGCNALLPAALASQVQFVALCDVYKPAFDRARQILGEAGSGIETYGDYRRVLARKDVDVVFIASPDHWHGPLVVAACDAGKDAYVEKPLANSIEDGLAMIEAVKRTKRVVQVGLQQRSMKIYHEALTLLDQGTIGKVYRVAMTWGGRAGWEPRPPDPIKDPPSDLDWESFQGSAPRRPYRATRQRSWRSYWEYGTGSLTDLGVHLMDVTRWFMRAGMPRAAHGVAVRSRARSEEQVWDVADLSWQYDDFVATFTLRDDMMNTFQGETGQIAVNRSVLRTTRYAGPGGKPETTEQRIIDPGFSDARPRVHAGDGAHVRNFIEAVRSRKDPSSTVQTAFDSTLTCQLAVRSAKTGKAYRWDGRKIVEV